MTVGELIMRLERLDKDKEISIIEMLNILNNIYVSVNKDKE